jgi:hypothetical protein
MPAVRNANGYTFRGTGAMCRIMRAAVLALIAFVISGCVTTSMQGYADRERPAKALQHIAVVAPPALVSALASEGAKRGVLLEDGSTIVLQLGNTATPRCGTSSRLKALTVFW